MEKCELIESWMKAMYTFDWYSDSIMIQISRWRNIVCRILSQCGSTQFSGESYLSNPFKLKFWSILNLTFFSETTPSWLNRWRNSILLGLFLRSSISAGVTKANRFVTAMLLTSSTVHVLRSPKSVFKLFKTLNACNKEL